MLWKRTIIMMVAFGLLTIAALGVSALPKGNKGPGIELPLLQIDSINKIEVTKISDPFTLEKSGDSWKILPLGKSVDSKRIESALKTLAELRVGTVVSKSSSNFDKYGVEDNSMTLAAYTTNGDPLRLVIGKESGDKRGNYARMPGDNRIFSTTTRIKSTFQKKPDNWRDKTIVSFESGTAIKLIVTNESETVSFDKNKEGQWKFASRPENLPNDFKLDPEKVDQTARSLSNLRASEFVDEVPTDIKTGLDKPSVNIKVELKQGEPIHILLGNEKDKKTYTKKDNSKQIYLISEYVVKKLKMKVDDFRDMHLAHLDQNEVKEMEINLGKKKFSFKKDKKWALAEYSEQSPTNFRLDPEKIESLISTVSRFQGKKILGKSAPAGSGLGKPEGILILTLEDGSKKKIKIGNENDSKERYVQGDDGTVYFAAKYGIERLLKPLDHYKVTAKQQQPMLSPDALKNLPPEVAQQLMQKQRQQIMQKQILNRIQKQKQQQGQK